jgi:protein-S-isoprenylcysteine O-methyltransferase Ste14
LKGTGYLVQATLILLWWLGLTISDVFFNAFQFPNISVQAFNSFFAPDIAVIASLSILRSYKNSKALEFIILGGFAYGTLYCINAALLTQGGYLSTTLMTLGLFYNVFLVFQDYIFRESGSTSTVVNGSKTIIQIVCVWGITLIFFPWMLTEAFGKKFIPYNTTSLVSGLVLLIISSALGLASAMIMVKLGRGTPLPINQTTKLVIAGPYRYVRNPMAIAGLGQGIAVSLIVASVPIFIYALLGAVLWQWVVRPIEEKNMAKRFEPEYSEYRKNVRCWIPKVIKPSK